jgi:hypothetical protein
MVTLNPLPVRSPTPVKKVTRPESEKPAIKPYSKADIETVLAACNSTRRYILLGKSECRREPFWARRMLQSEDLREGIKTPHWIMGPVGLLLALFSVCQITLASLTRRNQELVHCFSH